MKTIGWRLLFVFALTLPLLAGCGGKKVLFVDQHEPEDFSLSFQHPIVFEYEVEEDGKYDWEVELTYFPEQMQGWNEVPVYYIYTDQDKKDSEGKFSIPIHERNGDWAGELQENGHDRLMNFVFEEGKELKKGKHQMRFYGDNKQQGQPILGIVRFTFKVLQ